MTPDRMRLKIGLACGWTEQQSKTDVGFSTWTSPSGIDYMGLPDFPNDLNAMYEVEKIAPAEYWDNLAEITGCDGNPYGECVPPLHWAPFASASASQRAEAFLRTLNLWED